jgi:hypothetical protein
VCSSNCTWSLTGSTSPISSNSVVIVAASPAPAWSARKRVERRLRAPARCRRAA